jgi:hypothetical protein
MTEAMSGTPATSQPPDTKLAAGILVQLNILRKNSRIYADGHPALQAAVRRTLQLLEQFFAAGEELSLTVTRDSLFYGGHEFPRQNPVVAEFISSLHDLPIYVFTLRPGLTEIELIQLTRLLSGEHKADTSLDVAVARITGGHADVRLIDWSTSEFTDEAEIDLTAGGTEETSWEAFIRHLLQQGGDDLSAGVGGPSPAERGDGPPGGPAEQGGTPALTTTWSRVRRAARCVRGDLRPVVLDSLAPPASPSLREAAAFLEDAAAQPILEVLDGLSAAGRTIHPKALALAQALAAPGPAGAEWPIEKLGRASEAGAAEYIRTFLGVEGFPSPPASGGDPPPSGPSEASAQAAPLGDSVVRDVPRHYAGILVDLLPAATKPATAEACARALADLILASSLAADWEAVIAAWQGTDRLLARADLTPALHDLCHKARIQFGDAERLSRLVAAVLAGGVDRAEGLGEILRLAGPLAVEPLMEALSRADESALPGLVSLTVAMQEHTLARVVACLDDPRESVVCRMLAVLRELRDPAQVARIEKLLGHRQIQVRLEALRTMVILGSRRAPALLVRGIQSSNEEMSLGAIAVARHTQHPDVIRTLLAVTTESSWRKAYDLPRKIEAARSLVVMGQREALRELHGLLARRPFFHAKAFRQLQVEIFRALAEADVPDLETFIQLGRKIKDAEIAASCREMERRLRGRGAAQPPRRQPETPK